MLIQSTVNYWDIIPDEIALEIIKKSKSIDLISLQVVCKRFYTLVNDVFGEMSQQIANSSENRTHLAAKHSKLPALTKLIVQIKEIQREVISFKRKARDNIGYRDRVKTKRLAHDIEHYPQVLKQIKTEKREVVIKSYHFAYKIAQHLNLSLDKFPEEIKRIEDRVYIDQLWQWMGSQTKLSRIKELKFSERDDITIIPNEVKYLEKLEKINLVGRPLIFVSPEIKHLTRLNELSLVNCSLCHLTDEIGHLTTLRVLDVSENKLKTLPQGMERLQSLRMLSLYGNAFTSLPYNLVNLTSLKSLHIGENPFKGMPSVIQKLQQSNPNLKIKS